MYTQCPQCNTVFRIHTDQLSQARGQVRCGMCGHCFNALESLTEHLDKFGAPPSPGIEAAQAAERGERLAPGLLDRAQAKPAVTPPPLPTQENAAPPEQFDAAAVFKVESAPLTPVDRETAGFTSPWESAATRRAATADRLSQPPAAQGAAASAGVATEIFPHKEAGTAAKPLSARPDSALPDLGIIAAEPRPVMAAERPAGPLKTALWAIANVALIAVLLGQYAYFNRTDLAQYPELQPWLARLCAALSCDAPLQRDVGRITLANRIVQSNPSHPNALLIDATLINEADFPQPYPLLEIRFSDLSNQLVAGRRFRPSEYLPANTALEAGMPSHRPVHIRLEIVDPGKDAVSFQFELL